ncbi:MAG: RidA family protein [Rhodospirillaceae bacterium]|nr:RidA family protein [Rhodospirillaceae bacterium]MBT5456301.1 RidA family protein [Rhodospirillaceae bacterium]
MKRTNLSSAYQRSRSYSPAVITEGGRTIWLAGHLAAEDEDGTSLAGDFDGQVRCVFRKLDATLREADACLADIVTMTIFIVDVAQNSRFVELRKEFFSDENYPASTLVTVAALNRPELMVEINAVAIAPQSSS